MAPPKVFILGATGYIGGDALYAIYNAHPDWVYTCLVRNSDKGAKVAAQYPKIRLVYGNLDSVDLIAEESANADIVYTFADCDHVASAEAVVRGVRSKTTPSWLIHTSGTGILLYETVEKNAFGKALPKVYNDFDGISEVTSLPDHALHRNVDKIILAAHENHPLVHTAIVSPPTIYGLGRGPDNIDSIQANLVAREILRRGEGFSINGSKNIWYQVHIHDLSQLYLLLSEAAAINEGATGSAATWNAQGYYFATSQSFVWYSIIAAITEHAHSLGLIKSPTVRSLSVPEIEEFSPQFSLFIGANSVAETIRARKLLGWDDPVGRAVGGLIGTVPEVVEREARKLGVLKSHAERVGE